MTTTAGTISGDGPPADGSRYDAIVVGAGHNGLIAAGYLAKAGKKVLVLERRSIIGGATVTEEWFPGYHLSTCSYVCNLLLPEVIADLELERHGYDVRPFDPHYFVPFPDGSYFMSFLDGRKTREQIAKFSQRDVAGYDAYWAMWDRILERMRPLLLQPAPTWDQIEARFSGPQGQEDWRTLTRKSIAELLDEYFESEQIKAPLSTGGVIGVNAGPMTPGTAYVKYHHLIGSIGGHQGAWGFVRGGMGSIPKAIAAFDREHGVEIATDSEVAEIEIQDGSATGVRTVDGRRYRADIVLSNADPTRTFLGMVGESHLPAEFADGREADQGQGLGGQGADGPRRAAQLHRHAGDRRRPAAHRRHRHQPLGRLPRDRLGRLQARPSQPPPVHGLLHPDRDRGRPHPARQAHHEPLRAVRAVRSGRGHLGRAPGRDRRQHHRHARHVRAEHPERDRAHGGARPARHRAHHRHHRRQHLPRRDPAGPDVRLPARPGLQRLPHPGRPPLSLRLRRLAGRRGLRRAGPQLRARGAPRSRQQSIVGAQPPPTRSGELLTDRASTSSAEPASSTRPACVPPRS